MLHISDELRLSYALRCRVYCEERGFLSIADYPDGIEKDEFDDHSLHFGSFDAEGDMVGSVRMVLRSPLGFPMFDHCAIDPIWRMKIEAIPNLFEISRLVVSRGCRRQADRGFYTIELPSNGGTPVHSVHSDRRERGSVAVSLFKAMYQAARRLHITHSLSAMELTLHRLLRRYHFPFEKIGPECDYFGRVTPFILDVTKTAERLATDYQDRPHTFH